MIIIPSHIPINLTALVQLTIYMLPFLVTMLVIRKITKTTNRN